MWLGIDIGTTKVAAVVVGSDGAVLAVASRDHGAALPAAPGRAEQDPERLLAAAWDRVRELPADLRRGVRAVGVTGQMHGAMLLDAAGRVVAPLVTWQDGRCMEEPGFLPDLERRTGHPLRTGYGAATLAWAAAHGGLPAGACCAAIIQDLAVARLCGLARPVTDPTLAAAFGLFEPETGDWDRAAARHAGVPESLLPGLLPCGAQAGSVQAGLAASLGIPAGIPVAVGIGDNQASLHATLREPFREVALTLGTGGQVSVVLPVGAAAPDPQTGDAFEYRPYVDGGRVLVAAALCGGAAWAWLVDSLTRGLQELGQEPPEREWLFARLDELARRSEQELTVDPAFLGERHDPGRRGAIHGLDLGNFSVGALARGLGRGIVRNLRTMLPPEALAGRAALVASGNALRRSRLLREMAEAEFGLPLRLTEGREEAATGAALLAGRLVNRGQRS